MIFGKRIKELRIEKQWTQDYVCSKLNISAGALSRYETGMYEPKSLELVKDFADLFGVSTDYLLGKSYYKNQKEFEELDDLVLNYDKTPEEANLIAGTLNYINSHKSENIDVIISNALKDFPFEKRELLTKIINHLHYRYHGKLPEKTVDNVQEFQFAYHKETEGLTDEEIADALRFYKEMKKRVGGNNGNK